MKKLHTMSKPNESLYNGDLYKTATVLENRPLCTFLKAGRVLKFKTDLHH